LLLVGCSSGLPLFTLITNNRGQLMEMDNSTRLHKAVEANDIESVKTLLESLHDNGIDINEEDEGHKTVRSFLVFDIPCLYNECILSNLIIVYTPANKIKQALILACINGNIDIVKLLLDTGCPAQPPSGFKHSPLRGACICGHYQLIPLLLQYGADPNALSEGDRTPLMGCVFMRDGVDAAKSAECVKALLAHERTDPTRRNTFGESALDLAHVRGYTESAILIQAALDKWEERGTK
jgi:uncharacterized protein